METSLSVLDDALGRVSALEFAPPVRFVSHAAMACEALSTLGLDDVIDDWVEYFEASLVAAPSAVPPVWHGDFDWEGLVGDSRLLPQWLGYFDASIAEEGWPTVVEQWVPRLMPGLASALFHGVIRTSHAVRAIDRADTPARRAELVRGLANWATWFRPGPEVVSTGRRDDPAQAALRAAAVGARCYVARPTIVDLHGVTGAMAVELLTHHIPPADADDAVGQLAAEHQDLYRGVVPVEDRDLDPTGWDDDLARAAAESGDPHQVKLVEACRRGFEIIGDAGFLEASRTVTGLDRR
jgi:hypothetical protein